MGEKLPQETAVLVHRLQRVAKWLDSGANADNLGAMSSKAAMRARANTCWQAAARLEALAAKEESNQ